MRINNLQQVDDYPENYDNITDEQKNIIINFMNAMQDLANRYYKEYFDSEILNKENNNDRKEHLLKLYQQTVDTLTGAKNAYRTLGFMVEYNWPQKKGKWILATKKDAAYYEEHKNDKPSDYERTTQTLIQYGDIQ